MMNKDVSALFKLYFVYCCPQRCIEQQQDAAQHTAKFRCIRHLTQPHKFTKNVENKKIGFFVIVGANFRHFSHKKLNLSSKKATEPLIFPLLNIFILIHDVYRNFDENCIKTIKIGKFWSFCLFCNDFESFWGHFSHAQKSPKMSTNTYHTKLN